MSGMKVGVCVDKAQVIEPITELAGAHECKEENMMYLYFKRSIQKNTLHHANECHRHCTHFVK